MKFKSYLNESISSEEIISLIERDCKPFLRDWNKLNTDDFLYSGRQDNVDFAKKKMRSGRNPLTTNRKWHKILDDWFLDKFGVRARSNSLFCLFEDDTAGTYGNTYMIFPIGKYKAISSEKVEDMFIDVSKITEHGNSDVENKKGLINMLDNAE